MCKNRSSDLEMTSGKWLRSDDRSVFNPEWTESTVEEGRFMVVSLEEVNRKRVMIVEGQQSPAVPAPLPSEESVTSREWDAVLEEIKGRNRNTELNAADPIFETKHTYRRREKDPKMNTDMAPALAQNPVGCKPLIRNPTVASKDSGLLTSGRDLHGVPGMGLKAKKKRPKDLEPSMEPHEEGKNLRRETTVGAWATTRTFPSGTKGVWIVRTDDETEPIENESAQAVGQLPSPGSMNFI